jgi:high affinity Mn2+ porin
MGSFQAALDNSTRPADIEATRAYRQKFGFGLNLEQELLANVGAFARLGWNDGRTEPWCFSDVDRTVSAGLSVKGEVWHRPADTLGIAGVLNGLSGVHREFLAAGGQGILAGDGALSFAWERTLESYYEFRVGPHVGVTFDYQFVMNPANNQDRGPVSVFGGRVHLEF